MLRYEKGDLFNYIKNMTVMIPHICNDIGEFDKGFVVPLAEYCPKVKEDYLRCYQDFKLGKTQFISIQLPFESRSLVQLLTKPLTRLVMIANMIAQKGIVSKKNPIPIQYSSLVHCMNQVADKCIKNNIPIHAPKFGSGLAGGNWDFIEQLIIALWIDRGIDVTIYEL